MRRTLFVAAFGMVAWTIAYVSGKHADEIGSWLILVGLVWGGIVGAGLSVYSRKVDR